jgi:hypothetical protein
MALANCSSCQKVEDTRSMTLCPACSQWVCANCLNESGQCLLCASEPEENER